MGKRLQARRSDEINGDETTFDLPVVHRRLRRKRVPKYHRQLRRLAAAANYIKIMRFRSKTLSKTFRVYCFDEKTLHWPSRFTKKVNTMLIDNDQDSDEQEVQSAKSKCLSQLMTAIKSRKKKIAKRR